MLVVYLYSSLTQYFFKRSMHDVTKLYKGKDLLKVEDRSMDFHVIRYKKVIDKSFSFHNAADL